MKYNGSQIRVWTNTPLSMPTLVVLVVIALIFCSSGNRLSAQTSNTSTAGDQASDLVAEVVSDSNGITSDPVSLDFLNEGNNPKSLAQLRAMQDHVREVSDRVKQCTVNINVGAGQGTGVLVSSDGIILTAAHVIERPLRVALITFSDGTQAHARTLGVEAGKDSGMLKIYKVLKRKKEKAKAEEADEGADEGADEKSADEEETETQEGESNDQTTGEQETDDEPSDEEPSDEDPSDEDPEALPLKKDEPEEAQEQIDYVAAAFEDNDLPFFPYLDLGISQDLKDGQWVIAVGHPGGLDKKRGMVVRVGRIINQRDTAVRTDCTLVGGDSGGPLVDMDGNLIAIHSRIGSRLQDNLHVPVDVFSDTWDMLINGYKIGEAGKLGVTISPQSTLVSDLEKNGPAARAGIQVGDIISTIGGKAVADRSEIGLALADRYPYEKIDVTVLRGSKEVQLEVMLGESKQARNRRWRRR